MCRSSVAFRPVRLGLRLNPIRCDQISARHGPEDQGSRSRVGDTWLRPDSSSDTQQAHVQDEKCLLERSRCYVLLARPVAPILECLGASSPIILMTLDFQDKNNAPWQYSRGEIYYLVFARLWIVLVLGSIKQALSTSLFTTRFVIGISASCLLVSLENSFSFSPLFFFLFFQLPVATAVNMVGVPGKYKGCETCRARRIKVSIQCPSRQAIQAC